jgi:hypothetical protein
VGPLQHRWPWYCSFRVICARTEVLDSLDTRSDLLTYTGQVASQFVVPVAREVWGDVCVEVYQHRTRARTSRRKLCMFLVINTAFHHGTVVFSKEHVDIISKDKRHKLTPATFTFTLSFRDEGTHASGNRVSAAPLPGQASARLQAGNNARQQHPDPALSTDAMGLSAMLSGKSEWFHALCQLHGVPAVFRRGADILAPHHATDSFFYITRGTVEAVVSVGRNKSRSHRHYQAHTCDQNHHNHTHSHDCNGVQKQGDPDLLQSPLDSSNTRNDHVLLQHHPHGRYVQRARNSQLEQVPCVGIKGPGSIIYTDAFFSLTPRGVTCRARSLMVEGYFVSRSEGVSCSQPSANPSASEQTDTFARSAANTSRMHDISESHEDLPTVSDSGQILTVDQALGILEQVSNLGSNTDATKAQPSKTRVGTTSNSPRRSTTLLAKDSQFPLAQTALPQAPASVARLSVTSGSICNQLQVEGVETSRLADFHEVIACLTARELLRMRTEAERMMSLRALNCHSTVLGKDDESAQLLESVRRSFHLPYHEAIHHVCKCSMRWSGADVTGTWSEARAIVLTSFLVFDFEVFGPVVSRTSLVLHDDEIIDIDSDLRNMQQSPHTITISCSSGRTRTSAMQSGRRKGKGWTSGSALILEGTTRKIVLQVVQEKPAYRLLTALKKMAASARDKRNRQHEDPFLSAQIQELLARGKSHSVLPGSCFRIPAEPKGRARSFLYVKRGNFYLSKNGEVVGYLDEGTMFGLAEFALGGIALNGYSLQASGNSEEFVIVHVTHQLMLSMCASAASMHDLPAAVYRACTISMLQDLRDLWRRVFPAVLLEPQKCEDRQSVTREAGRRGDAGHGTDIQPPVHPARAPPQAPQTMMTFDIRRQTFIRGSNGALGVLFNKKDQSSHYSVENLVKGGPADMSGGIQLGDLIMSVNDTPISSLSVDEVVDLIQGTPSSSVVLGIATPALNFATPRLEGGSEVGELDRKQGGSPQGRQATWLAATAAQAINLAIRALAIESPERAALSSNVAGTEANNIIKDRSSLDSDPASRRISGSLKREGSNTLARKMVLFDDASTDATSLHRNSITHTSAHMLVRQSEQLSESEPIHSDRESVYNKATGQGGAQRVSQRSRGSSKGDQRSRAGGLRVDSIFGERNLIRSDLRAKQRHAPPPQPIVQAQLGNFVTNGAHLHPERSSAPRPFGDSEKASQLLRVRASASSSRDSAASSLALQSPALREPMPGIPYLQTRRSSVVVTPLASGFSQSSPTLSDVQAEHAQRAQHADSIPLLVAELRSRSLQPRQNKNGCAGLGDQSQQPELQAGHGLFLEVASLEKRRWAEAKADEGEYRREQGARRTGSSSMGIQLWPQPEGPQARTQETRVARARWNQNLAPAHLQDGHHDGSVSVAPVMTVFDMRFGGLQREALWSKGEREDSMRDVRGVMREGLKRGSDESQVPLGAEARKPLKVRAVGLAENSDPLRNVPKVLQTTPRHAMRTALSRPAWDGETS